MKRRKLLIIGLTLLAICSILLFKAMNNNNFSLQKASPSEQIQAAYKQNQPMWLLFKSKT